jgi:hypothetical protein
MQTLCVCGIYSTEVEHATFVRDGRPLCHHETCQKVRHHGRLVPRYEPVPLASPEEMNNAA